MAAPKKKPTEPPRLQSRGARPSGSAPRRDQFGDLTIHLTGPTWTPRVVEAPDLTRIALAVINGAGTGVTVDEHGINIADQVWYTAVDIGPNHTILCRKTRDLRKEGGKP